VLVKRSEPLTKSKGGIIIIEVHKSEVNVGQVVAAGPGFTLTNGVHRPIAVAVGQNVLFPSYAGVKIKLADEQEYWVYRDDDILAILEQHLEPAPAKAAKKL
jgi:chaperonin GroES